MQVIFHLLSPIHVQSSGPIAIKRLKVQAKRYVSRQTGKVAYKHNTDSVCLGTLY